MERGLFGKIKGLFGRTIDRMDAPDPSDVEWANHILSVDSYLDLTPADTLSFVAKRRAYIARMVNLSQASGPGPDANTRYLLTKESHMLDQGDPEEIFHAMQKEAADIESRVQYPKSIPAPSRSREIKIRPPKSNSTV